MNWQPIFHPVLSEKYATKIARDWNTNDGGTGYVTTFEVDGAHLSQYEPHEVGGREHREYWIPAEELELFNDAIVGEIRVVAECLLRGVSATTTGPTGSKALIYTLHRIGSGAGTSNALISEQVARYSPMSRTMSTTPLCPNACWARA